MAKGIIESMLPGVDAILKIRDRTGAFIHSVSMVTRTWYADDTLAAPSTQPGEGVAKDMVVPLTPTPGIRSYAQDIRLKEGGSVKAGDIILTGVSRYSWKEVDLDGSTSAPNIEKFYLVGAKLYQVINVTESYLTWNVQLRETTNQARY